MGTVQPRLSTEEIEEIGNSESHGENNGQIPIAAKHLWKLRKYLVLLGTLAVSVTYNSGLTPPGGFWYKNKDGHKAGDPALHAEFYQRHEVFFYCNATAFAASLVLIILLLSKSVTRQELWLRSMQFTMLVDLFSLMGAYTAGSCRALKSSIYILVLVFAVFSYVWIYILLSTRIVSETLKENVAAEVTRILSNCKFAICNLQVCKREKFMSATDRDKACKFILMLVTFSATITYQAGLSPPGGFWAENDYFSGTSPPYKHRPATPALRNHYLHRYKIFVSCNSTSFVASLVTIILLLSPGLSEHGKRSKSVVFCVVADLLCLIGAYAAGCCRDMRRSVYVMLIIVIILICIAVLAWIFACERVAVWLQKIKDKFVSCIYEVDRALSMTSDAGQQSTLANRHQDSVQTAGVPAEDQNSQGNQTEEHLKKTRTCLLLLAILAVSLTYQSGLNPPGGFWSTSEDKHSAGDRILEDNNHLRFIAFFYLNAVAFVASFVMILIILSKSISEKVTKRHELQIAMVVCLLSLTGAFIMGSCREAKKSIYISVLVCIFLAYVRFHVLLWNVIPIQCKNLVADTLKQFWSALTQLCNKETENSTTENELEPKELERRSNLLLTLAIVAATVTYQAGINPPGGVWSDDRDVSGSPGNPILQDNRPGRYYVFYYSNSVAFVSSVVITILLVNKEYIEHGIKSYALRLCLMVGLLGLLIAYAAGSCRNKIQSIFLIIIAVAVLVSLVIQALLPSIHDTLGKPLDAFVEFLQKWVFLTKTVEPEVICRTPETLNPDENMENKRHKYLMLIAILAASITYQAGLNPPGGLWSDDNNGHVAGNPILHDINNRRYMTFFYFNSFSFMASIVVIVIILLLSTSATKKYVPFEVLLCLVMILDLLALMVAFAAGSCRKFRTSVYVLLLVAVVVIFLVFIRFLASAIAKLLRKLKKRLKKWKRSGCPLLRGS
jgi:hypothetical protein